MQHCPARAAQRLAAAVLALCLVLALAVPHAHAAALQETHGIRMLDFSTSQILSIGNQTSGKCSWYALRYARTILDGKVSSGSGMCQTVRSGLRAATTVIPAACPSACRSFTPSFPPGSR